MFWDKKEKKLPDLPQPRGSLEFPRVHNALGMSDNLERTKVHELPSFPDSPMKKGFSQAAIKDAVMTEGRGEDSLEDDDLPRLPDEMEHEEESSDKFKLTEMEEWSPPKRVAENIMPARRASEIKSVFVKIDKFKSAKESLKAIEQGLQEIEDLLNHIREVKAREDQELSSWEKEMENLKSRIGNVISDIFDRVEG